MKPAQSADTARPCEFCGEMITGAEARPVRTGGVDRAEVCCVDEALCDSRNPTRLKHYRPQHNDGQVAP